MSDQPIIHLAYDPGAHNGDLVKTQKRLSRQRGYANLSTVIVAPVTGPIQPRIVETWWSLLTPMNQPAYRMLVERAEVGSAYEAALDVIFNSQLNEWSYLLTLEHDNLVPPDALIKLVEAIEKGPYDAVGSLYFTKGEAGAPMIYGDPARVPVSFEPQQIHPDQHGLQETNGIGMGCSLFRISALKRLERPIFQTLTGSEGKGLMTQDLYACKAMREAGMRIAVDTNVRVGHLDFSTGVVW
jgi:hypothetical protein